MDQYDAVAQEAVVKAKDELISKMQDRYKYGVDRDIKDTVGNREGDLYGGQWMNAKKWDERFAEYAGILHQQYRTRIAMLTGQKKRLSSEYADLENDSSISDSDKKSQLETLERKIQSFEDSISRVESRIDELRQKIDAIEQMEEQRGYEKTVENMVDFMDAYFEKNGFSSENLDRLRLTPLSKWHTLMPDSGWKSADFTVRVLPNDPYLTPLDSPQIVEPKITRYQSDTVPSRIIRDEESVVTDDETAQLSHDGKSEAEL